MTSNVIRAFFAWDGSYVNKTTHKKNNSRIWGWFFNYSFNPYMKYMLYICILYITDAYLHSWALDDCNYDVEDKVNYNNAIYS